MDGHVPSPVLHSFSAFALLQLSRDATEGRRVPIALLGALIFAANAPDLDFVAGIAAGAPRRFHRGASHSLFAAGIFGLGAFLVAKVAGWRSSRRFGVLMGLAFASHVFLDMLSPLGEPEQGVALAWPVLTERVSFPVRIFSAVRFDRTADSLLEGWLQVRNFLVVLSELVLVGVIWGLARLTRRTSRTGA